MNKANQHERKFIAIVCAMNACDQFFYQLSYHGQHCGALFPNGVGAYEHYGTLGMTPYTGILADVAFEAAMSELAAQEVARVITPSYKPLQEANHG